MLHPCCIHSPLKLTHNFGKWLINRAYGLLCRFASPLGSRCSPWWPIPPDTYMTAMHYGSLQGAWTAHPGIPGFVLYLAYSRALHSDFMQMLTVALPTMAPGVSMQENLLLVIIKLCTVCNADRYYIQSTVHLPLAISDTITKVER